MASLYNTARTCLKRCALTRCWPPASGSASLLGERPSPPRSRLDIVGDIRSHSVGPNVGNKINPLTVPTNNIPAGGLARDGGSTAQLALLRDTVARFHHAVITDNTPSWAPLRRQGFTWLTHSPHAHAYHGAHGRCVVVPCGLFLASDRINRTTWLGVRCRGVQFDI